MGNSPKKEIAVGGQAVIEGVMMRGPEYISTAIRRSDDTIEVKKEPFTSITQKNKILGLPLIRGFISLFEMMFIGYKTLSFSVQRAELDMEEEPNAKKKSDGRLKFEEFISIIFALGFAFLLFAFLPYKLASLLHLDKNNVYFNLFSGSLRIIFFVVYVWTISFMKDVKRLFRYHGAEHKSVFAYEQNEALIPQKVQKFSTLHPRCGTSFMFFVLLISILIFSIVDTLVSWKFGIPTVLQRLGYHFLLLPLISGVSYEVLRYSGKNINHPLVKLMTLPGMSLQRITTQPPDDKMIEVAVVALKSALELDLSEHKNIIFLED